MEKVILKTKGGNYSALFQKGIKHNNVAFVYYHGLGGQSKIVQPLIKKLTEFDFYSVEERGHANSLQKASTSPKKHDKDIYFVVNHLKEKYKQIYLCGESMGGLFSSRYAYKWNEVNGVFCWSIPFYPKNIMKDKFSKKFLIIFRVILCFLFGWNYQYQAVIDYPKLTNSKFLMKLHELNIQTKNNTSEEIAIWKGSLGIKRKFLKKRPKVKIYYWQGTHDIMSSSKILNKIKKKNFIEVNEIQNAKHILMFEKDAEIIFDKMIEIAKINLD